MNEQQKSRRREFTNDCSARVVRLLGRHQRVFGCCICERLEPSFRAFCVDEGLESGVFAQVLDLLWTDLRGTPISNKQISVQRQAIEKIPVNDDCKSIFTGVALDALTCIDSLIANWRTKDLAWISLISETAQSSIDEWIAITSEYAPVFDTNSLQVDKILGIRKQYPSKDERNKKSEAQEEYQYHHPMAVGERNQQIRDILVLEHASTLEDDLVQLLRAVSQVKGIQPYLRGLRPDSSHVVDRVT